MVLCLVTIGCIVCMVPVWVPLCTVSGLIFGVPVGAAHNFVALWTGSTLSVVIGRYFFREPIRERLFDGDAFAYRFMWRTSTRTDSWHSDSPRRHACLTTETGTMALFSPWRCLRFSYRQRDGHSCLTTETGTMAFLASVTDTPVWQQRQISQRAQFIFPRNLFLHSRSKQCSHDTLCRK